MLVQNVNQNKRYAWFSAAFTSSVGGTGQATITGDNPLQRAIAYIVQGAAAPVGTFVAQRTGTAAAVSYPNNTTPATFPAAIGVQMDWPADVGAFLRGNDLTFDFTDLAATQPYTVSLLVEFDAGC